MSLVEPGGLGGAGRNAGRVVYFHEEVGLALPAVRRSGAVLAVLFAGLAIPRDVRETVGCIRPHSAKGRLDAVVQVKVEKELISRDLHALVAHVAVGPVLAARAVSQAGNAQGDVTVR